MPRKKIKRKLSQCREKDCVGRYESFYEDNIPIFVCNVCGDRNLSWKKFYEEYMQLYAKKENWEIKKHQISCIIGFFCYSYKQFYNLDYIFVPRSINPFSSKECKDATIMLKVFGNDPILARKYIYWFFNKFLHSSIEISSLGYLNSPNIIRKYNLYHKKKQKLNRSSNLPKKFIRWCEDNASDIFSSYSLKTMNDLGALLGYCKGAETGSVERNVLDQAERYNLIKMGKLNVE